MKSKPKPKAPEEEITLASLAKDTLELLNGDVHAAENSLVFQLRDEETRQKVIESAIREACASYVSKAHREQRATILGNIVTFESRKEQGLTKSLEMNVKQLMHYPLMRGVKLGDARKFQVVEQAEYHNRIEKDARRKRTWFFKIADKLPDEKKTVKEVISVKELYKLYCEAFHAK